MDAQAKHAKADADHHGKVVVGYWNIRGLLSPIVYLLEYVDADFELVKYEGQDWAEAKEKLGLDFPNLPYLVDGDLKFSESQAIIRYICNKYNPKLLGVDLKEKAIVDQLAFAISDYKGNVTGHCYGSGDLEAVHKYVLEKTKRISSFLGQKKFLIGDHVTFADFLLFEYAELCDYLLKGKFFEEFPNLKSHHNHMLTLPKFGEFVKSDRFTKRPFNGKSAKLNN